MLHMHSCVSLPEAFCLPFSLPVFEKLLRLSLGVTLWLPFLIHPFWVRCPFVGPHYTSTRSAVPPATLSGSQHCGFLGLISHFCLPTWHGHEA